MVLRAGGPGTGWDLLSTDRQHELMKEAGLMAMGNSGGRSRGNRTGQGAERRNTPRERAAIDPVFPEGPPEVRFQKTDEAHWVDVLFGWVAAVSIIFFGVLGAIILAAWFGAFR